MTHPKDIGRQPGTVHLTDVEGNARAHRESVACQHIHFGDGWVETRQEDGEVVYPAWRVIEVEFTND